MHILRMTDMLPYMSPRWGVAHGVVHFRPALLKSGADSCAGVLRSIMDRMRNSTFCLSMPGDSASTRRLSETIMAGCIPVFIGTFSCPSSSSLCGLMMAFIGTGSAVPCSQHAGVQALSHSEPETCFEAPLSNSRSCKVSPHQFAPSCATSASLSRASHSARQ